MKKLKELKNDINVEKVKKESRSFVKEFKEFAIKGNAVDLAIGMVIGSAFTGIINSLVKDIITPLIGIITGGIDFSKLYISLDGNTYASLSEAQELGAAVLTYGTFITTVVNFLIVALAIFIIFKKILAPKKKTETVVAEPTEKECPYCLSTINIAAKRCPHCTSELE